VESTSTSTEEGMPLVLEQAALEISKAWYHEVGKKIWDGRQKVQTVSQKQVGDLGITYEPETKPVAAGFKFPDSATEVLKSYQRLV